MRAPAFYAEPQVQFLSRLLAELADGVLQVPRFQRPLVWLPDQKLELLRSIRDGIPIGAIMIWRTNVTIEVYERFGPYHLKSLPAGLPHQYVLDGVQRLSTLYGALTAPTVPTLTLAEDADDVPYEEVSIRYSLEDDDFVIISKEEDRDEMLLPLTALLDSVALLKFQRGLQGTRAEEFIRATDQLASAFREYKVPIIPISTDDISIATRTFERINTQGTQMSELHMVHALTWSKGFDLQTLLGELSATYLGPVGWDALDNEVVLQVAKIRFDLDVYETEAEQLSKALRRNPTALEAAFRSLERAATFLRERCAVPGPGLVPYTLQTVLLAEAFRVLPEKPEEDRIRLLYAWFWASTYGELFRGMSGYRLSRTLEDVREMMHDGRSRWSGHQPFGPQPLRERYDFRAARAKGLAILMAAHHDQLAGGHPAQDLLRDLGARGVIQLVTHGILRSGAVSSPGNRFVARGEDVAKLKERLVNPASRKLREQHFVTEEAAELLAAKEWEKFIVERFNTLNDVEEGLIASIAPWFPIQA